MRVFPLAARVVVVCGLLVLASAPAVTADEDTAGENTVASLHGQEYFMCRSNCHAVT